MFTIYSCVRRPSVAFVNLLTNNFATKEEFVCDN